MIMRHTYIHFKWKTLRGEKTSSSRIVVSQATGRVPNNFTNLLITNSHCFDTCIRKSTFCGCDHLRWHCNIVGVTLVLHKSHRTLTARVANRGIEKLPTRQRKLYFFIFIRRSCRRVGKIFLIWGQEQFKICKILKTNSRYVSQKSSQIFELRLMQKYANGWMFIFISWVQRFPKRASRKPRDPWPVPRGSVDSVCNGCFWSILF